MAKYMVTGSYTAQGLQGVLKEGGTSRVKVVEQLLSGMGARLEAMYFAFGGNDFVCIAEASSNVDVAAVMLAINATGVLSASTTVLLTAEEIDQAVQKAVIYRPPGA